MEHYDEPAYDLPADLRKRFLAIAPGYVVRRLAGLHDIPHVVLAEYVGSTKQSVGPIVASKKPVGRNLANRLAAAFYVPTSLIMDGNYRLALAVGFLVMEVAPIQTFKPRGSEAPANWRKACEEAAVDAYAECQRFHHDNPHVLRQAMATVEDARRYTVDEVNAKNLAGEIPHGSVPSS